MTKLTEQERVERMIKAKAESNRMRKYLLKDYPGLYDMSTHDALLIKAAYLFGWEAKKLDLED